MKPIQLMWFYVDRFGCGNYRCYIPAFSMEESTQFTSSFIWQEDLRDQQSYIHDIVLTDIAILQRPPTSLFQQVIKDCREREIKIVIELDDYLMDVPRHNPASWLWRKKHIQKMFRNYLDSADLITVSTRPLQYSLTDLGIPKEKIILAQNHLHTVAWGKDVLNVEKHKNGDKIVIGWQGSTTHDTDFKVAIPALVRILDKYQNVILRLFGDTPRSVREAIPMNRFEWTGGVPYEMYPRRLAFCNFDIGIAPLTDSKFNECKSNIKWLEYSALKIPTVASSVNPYSSSIKNGSTGFLASNEADWFNYLELLINTETLRRELGENAYQDVWANWSSLQHYKSWSNAFESLVSLRVSG